MLAAMTSIQISRWEAWYIVENEGEPQDEEAAQVAALDLPAHAQAGLARMMSKRRAR